MDLRLLSSKAIVDGVPVQNLLTDPPSLVPPKLTILDSDSLFRIYQSNPPPESVTVPMYETPDSVFTTEFLDRIVPPSWPVRSTVLTTISEPLAHFTDPVLLDNEETYDEEVSDDEYTFGIDESHFESDDSSEDMDVVQVPHSSDTSYLHSTSPISSPTKSTEMSVDPLPCTESSIRQTTMNEENPLVNVLPTSLHYQYTLQVNPRQAEVLRNLLFYNVTLPTPQQQDTPNPTISAGKWRRRQAQREKKKDKLGEKQRVCFARSKKNFKTYLCQLEVQLPKLSSSWNEMVKTIRENCFSRSYKHLSSIVEKLYKFNYFSKLDLPPIPSRPNLLNLLKSQLQRDFKLIRNCQGDIRSAMKAKTLQNPSLSKNVPDIVHVTNSLRNTSVVPLNIETLLNGLFSHKTYPPTPQLSSHIKGYVGDTFFNEVLVLNQLVIASRKGHLLIFPRNEFRHTFQSDPIDNVQLVPLTLIPKFKDYKRAHPIIDHSYSNPYPEFSDIQHIEVLLGEPEECIPELDNLGEACNLQRALFPNVEFLDGATIRFNGFHTHTELYKVPHKVYAFEFSYLSPDSQSPISMICVPTNGSFSDINVASPYRNAAYKILPLLQNSTLNPSEQTNTKCKLFPACVALIGVPIPVSETFNTLSLILTTFEFQMVLERFLNQCPYTLDI